MEVNVVPIKETYGLNFDGRFLLDIECVNSAGQKVYPYLLKKQGGSGEWVFDVSLSGKSSEYQGFSLEGLLEAFRSGAFLRGAQLRMKPKLGGIGNGHAPLKGKISEFMMDLLSKNLAKRALTIDEAIKYLKNRYEVVYDEDGNRESFFVVFKSANGKVVAARKSYFSSASGPRGYEQVRSGVLLWANSFVPKNRDIIEYIDSVPKSPEGLVLGAPELRYSEYRGRVVRQVISLDGLELFCRSIESEEQGEVVGHIENSNIESTIPLNTILYGPPGTGKTYSVVLKSMSIVDGSDYGLQVSPDKYQELKKRYDKLVADGQISFVTFHQSYGYEDFIEGIRPRAEGQQISYEVKDGILKSIALRARQNWTRATLQSNDTLKQEAVFERVWQQLYIEMGASREGKIKLLRVEDGEICQGSPEKNVLVLVPTFKTTHQSLSKQELKKLWVRQQDITQASETTILDAYLYFNVLNHLKELGRNLPEDKPQPEQLKPFVTIIDEINRGNMSKIFGELITLVEEDKRLGEPFEMTVTLPYSQDDEEPFGLPPNLFLLGTMNTSDRSIALLDTALRRRFEFEELQPNPDLLKEVELDADIDLAAMLRDINERVEYLYDRDHTIGHAYFMGVKNLADLDRVFRRKVIPLLQEYFYEDWSKVVLVLNDHEGRFIAKTDDAPKGLQGADVGFDAKPRYKVRPEPFPVEAYRNLYT